MLEKERVDGFVPFSREDVHRRRVPPVLVELAIGETCEFCESIADAFEPV